jgi:predicted O-methyltransferase YrrM
MLAVEEDYVLDLYARYVDALKEVRENQKKIYSPYDESLKRLREHYISRLVPPRYLARTFIRSCQMALLNPQFDDIEAEITYLLIRASRPKTLVEISPSGGWSTSWILNAVRHNDYGTLYSYDLVDDSLKTLPQNLANSNWVFTKGDIKKTISEMPNDIDYLLMDADHSSDFATWYIQNIFPKLRSGALVSIHDVFHDTEPGQPFGEGKVITQWLQKNRISYITAAPAKNYSFYNRITKLKGELRISDNIHSGSANPMIFFFKYFL